MNNRIATFEDVNTFANRMRDEWRKMQRQLNGRADVTALHAEADEIRTKYADIPAQIRELEQSRATLVASVVELRESLELIEANLSLVCDGKNAEQRKAQLLIALAEDEQAAPLTKEIAVKELDIKLFDVEREEREDE